MLPTLALLAAQAVPYPKPGVLGIDLEGYPYPYPVRFLNVEKDLRLAYMDVRPKRANGRTVFLLHGKNFSGAYWKGTIARLAGEGYRVVVPDRIGFGKSSKPLIDYTFDFFARSDVTLADALRVRRFAVVAHSMGGMEAVRLASRYPGRVSRLVLEGPLGMEDYARHVPYRSAQERTQGEIAQTDEAFRRHVAGYYVRKDPALIEPFVALRAAIRRAPAFPRWAAVQARTTQTILYGTTLPELRRLALPTLFVIGEADRTSVGKAEVPEPQRAEVGNMPELARAAARAMPNARVIVVPKVGHIPHLESPSPFFAALLPFLKGG